MAGYCRFCLGFLFISLIFSVTSVPGLQAQELNSGNTGFGLSKNRVSYGVEKIVNTYLFTGDANINKDIFGGDLLINQRYKGTALKSSSSAYRDDESFDFRYSYPLLGSLSVLATQNWLLSSDTRSIGVNRTSRLNGSAGLRYNFSKLTYLETTAGLESNDYIGINAGGKILNVNAALNNENLFDYNLNGTLSGEYLQLADGRNYTDLDIGTNLSRYYGLGDKILLNLDYKLLNRDFLNPNIRTADNYYLIESRLEDNIGGDLTLGFDLSELLNTSINFRYSKLQVSRSYRNLVESVSFSGIYRELNELNLSFTGILNFKNKLLSQSAGITFASRNEENLVENKFNIDADKLESLRSQENQRDNNSSRTRLFSSTGLKLSRNDSLAADLTASIFRYNTPSTKNYDDRDEFFTMLKATYYRRFSYILQAAFVAELRMTHLVFLKAARSALNNWNRIIRLSPALRIRSKKLEMNPEFEVLANYTVYDFEDVAPGVKSFSFRQVSYRDSIDYHFNQNFGIEVGAVLRYYENATLFWNSFSESPQKGSYEQLLKLLFITSPSDKLTFGCGVRTYNLIQKKLSVKPLPGISNEDYIQKSWGPETLIRARMSDNSDISVRGWYEFQSINNKDFRTIPNFFILTNIYF